jgi:hypothetical protein
MQYITPNDYDIAEKNGLSKQLVYQRVYDYSWDVQDAITIPKRIRKNHGNWVKVALENGLSRSSFYGRLAEGMTAEEAATLPIRPRLTMVELVRISSDSRRTYPKEYGILADANKINRQTFRERLKRGWTLEDAATYPVMQKGERKAIRDARANGSRLQES